MDSRSMGPSNSEHKELGYKEGSGLSQLALRGSDIHATYGPLYIAKACNSPCLHVEVMEVVAVKLDDAADVALVDFLVGAAAADVHPDGDVLPHVDGVLVVAAQVAPPLEHFSAAASAANLFVLCVPQDDPVAGAAGGNSEGKVRVKVLATRYPRFSPLRNCSMMRYT